MAEQQALGMLHFAFIVNLLCDLSEEVLGGLCKQLRGSSRQFHEAQRIICLLFYLFFA